MINISSGALMTQVGGTGIAPSDNIHYVTGHAGTQCFGRVIASREAGLNR